MQQTTMHEHSIVTLHMSSTIGLPGDYTFLEPEQLGVPVNGTFSSVDTFSVTFSEGSDFSSNFTIEVIPDNTYEGIEYFMLEIVDIKEPAGFPGNLQVGTRSKVTVTVLDTDGEDLAPHMAAYWRWP